LIIGVMAAAHHIKLSIQAAQQLIQHTIKANLLVIILIKVIT